MTPAAPVALVEPFAGMAALSFGCMGCAPPISWMGSKRGYARVLMELLGLSRHNPPAAYIWGDVGPNVAALATLAGARGDARDVAGWLIQTGWSFRGVDGGPFDASRAIPNADLGRGALTLDGVADRIIGPRAAEVAAIIRGWKDEEPRALWTRLKAAGWPSLMPVEGGRWLGPQSVEEVAGFLQVTAWTHSGGMFCSPEPRWTDGAKAGLYPPSRGLTTAGLAARITDMAPTRVACYQGTATRLVEQLPGNLSGVLVYVDGPYHGDGSRKITGYKFGGCSREEQLALVADCHRRGARVAMSESVPLAAELRALTGDEWWGVDISDHRQGQVRSFTKNQGDDQKRPHEWVTLNRPPAIRPGIQTCLF